MKELSIEEKAKRYDEAIKVAKSKIKNDKDHVLYEDDVIEIFPELKESENERMRNATINACKYMVDNFENSTKQYEDAIAWLEKRSTPRVRTGLEWVNTIDDACDKRYSEEYAHGEYCHEQSFKWGFQEGVDWLEKQGEQNPTYTKEYDFHGMKFIPKFAKGDIIKDKKRGEVSTIEGFSYDTGLYTHTYGQFPITIQDNYEIIEQKPAWSEENDKYNYNIIIGVLKSQGASATSQDLLYERQINWLKSLKNKVQPKPKWSEEDEKILNSLISSLVRIGATTRTDSTSINYTFSKEIDWLKSLRPQNRWKPSDEQMNALNDVISSRDIKYDVLSELWKDLKKLK